METIDIYKMVEKLYRGKVDKGGEPYINHLVRVMLRASNKSTKPELAQACLLHDTLEDGLATAEELLRKGVSAEVVQAVVLLTRRDEDYATYIKNIQRSVARTGILACHVKVADLQDNLDPDRPYKNEDSALRRYRDALAQLGANWK